MIKWYWALFSGLLFLSCNNHHQPIAKEEQKIMVPPHPQKFISKSDSLKTLNNQNWVKNNFIDFIRSRKFNGAVLVADGNKVLMDTVTGYADFYTKEKLNNNSAFQLASITKPVTATVILQMLAEGKLALNDTLTHFFPQLPSNPYGQITLKMLLSHQSGLAQYYYYCDHILEDKNCILTNDCVFEIIDEHDPNHYYPPGKKFYYCNTNYVFLASIASKLDGLPFDKVVKNRILDPAQMHNSFVLDMVRKEPPSNMVLGNNIYNRIIDFDYLDGVTGDKGLFASARDLFEFDRHLHQCALLPDSLYQMATKAHTKIDRRKSAYGLGWRLRFDDELGKIVYHSGWWHGNRHIYFKIPSLDYTVIILSNSLRGSVYNLNELLEIFYSIKEDEKEGLAVQ